MTTEAIPLTNEEKQIKILLHLYRTFDYSKDIYVAAVSLFGYDIWYKSLKDYGGGK